MIHRDAIDRRARQRIARSGWEITVEPDPPCTCTISCQGQAALEAERTERTCRLSETRQRRWVARKEIVERNEEGDNETRVLYESDFTLEGLSAIVLRREREERDFGGRVLAS